MVGYGDSKKQMGHSIASERNELWGTSLMKLQLWNAIRGVDFLQSLPDVDPDRIACTGASGGGTQTFMLMAVDDRVKVASPVNMVSAFMQGGCECENAPLLRLDTINPEIAALMAPRPLLLVSTSGDWTSKTPQVEFPMVRSIYKLFGAEDRVENFHGTGPHNYNRASREAVYNFFLKHLLGRKLKERFKEPPYKIEKRGLLSVWADRDLPAGALDRKGLEEFLIRETKAILASYAPRNPRRLEKFREVIGSEYEHVIYVRGRGEGGPVAAEFLGFADLTSGGEKFHAVRLLLSRDDEKVPAVLYLGKGKDVLDEVRGKTAVLLVHPGGKAALSGADGTPGPYLRALLKRVPYVLTMDPFLTGEFHSAFGPVTRKRKDNRFPTYNRPALVERVRDIILAARFLEKRISPRTCVVGLGRAGRWSLLASPFLSGKTSLICDLEGYASEDEKAWRGEDFTPSILAVGALKTAAALAAPRTLTLFNVGPAFQSEWVSAAYHAARSADMIELTSSGLPPEELARKAAEK